MRRSKLVATIAVLMLAHSQSARAGAPVLFASPYPLVLSAGISMQSNETGSNCDAAHAGSLRYNTGNFFEGCNGTAWTTLGLSTASGVTASTTIGASPNASGSVVAASILTLEPASVGFGGVVVTAAQTFGGPKTFAGNLQANANLIFAGATAGSVSVVADPNTTAYTLTLPISAPAGNSFIQVNSTGGMTFIATPASGLTALTAASVGGTANANGMVVAGGTITLEPANSSNPGLIVTAAQTLPGPKTFAGAVTLSTNAVFSGSTSGSVTVQAPGTASWTMTLPISAGTAAQVLTTDGSGNTTWAAAAGGGGSATQPTIQYYASTPTPVGIVFYLRNGANATLGAIYTVSGNSYTVAGTIVSGSTASFFLFGTDSATSSMTGALTKVSGGGDASLPFQMMQQYGNYTAPAGVNHIKVSLIGGGGGGAGSGSTLATVPAAGNGGFSVFGFGTVIGIGGFGGNNTANAVAPGGNCTAGQIQVSGGGGMPPANNSGTSIGGSHGGAGMFGGNGWGGGVQGGSGGAGAANTGGGGGSPGQSGNPTLTGSGGGAGGYCESMVNSGFATAAVVVGAGGLAGSNGAGGAGNAAAGGSGNVQITEYYNP